MDVGYNIRLSPAEVAEALRAAALRKLGKKGRALDAEDSRAFHGAAEVFVKMNGAAIVSAGLVEEVTVTWSE